MSIQKAPFGKVGTEQADLYTLTNDSGSICKITNYGGIVTDIQVPDKDGNPGSVILGFDSLDKYLAGHPFFGCIAGRYANRIAKGKFTIDGTEYTLATNNGENHLHGGKKGFDKYIWDAQEIRGANFVGLILTRTSPDGEEGYPGNLVSTVTYKWTNDNALEIDYMAKTDKATAINLTNHCYFNLTSAKQSILDHEISLVADKIVPTDDGGIPTGGLMPVANTPFDFTTPHKIGARIGAGHKQITNGKGYDHTWVLNNQDGKVALAAKVTEATTGRTLEILTDQPGIQFYTGNYLDGTLTGRGGNVYKHRYGFCLETQVYPDSPNQEGFPKAILKPGETYTHHCTYKFSVAK
jgi:aldose 1-epimerase